MNRGDTVQLIVPEKGRKCGQLPSGTAQWFIYYFAERSMGALR